jgi:hypothetical protein
MYASVVVVMTQLLAEDDGDAAARAGHGFLPLAETIMVRVAAASVR